ncbi:MAG TPA: DNA topoisomerase IB [Acidimicrobiia bacterium]|nr:DNA topoisomerase IB [Acidimicrobiia bacterium]
MTERAASRDLAEAAGLLYMTDDQPGYRRMRRGKGFTYQGLEGETLNGNERARIESLVIPPAWDQVWISPKPRSHVLATGYDEAGRKQYIYHPDWEDARDEAKFDRMKPFGKRLIRLRKRIDSDLRMPGMARPKVVALAVAVLDQTLIRVGSRQYVEANESYGLTTLTADHVEVAGSHVHFAFAAKGGADQQLVFSDGRLASLIARCQELAGQTLFSYEGDEGVGAVSSTDVNLYLADATGQSFTAKDFRTWGATAIVAGHLASNGQSDISPAKQYLDAVDRAADRLGNTREIARGSYVHPIVEESFNDGRLSAAWHRSRRGKWLDRSESTVNRLFQA